MSDADEKSSEGAFVSEGLDPEQIEELRASVAALREHISSRFGVREEGESADAAPGVSGEPEAPAVEKRDAGFAATVTETLSAVDAWEIWHWMRSGISTLGMRPRATDTDDFGLDPLFIDQVRPLLDFLFDRWWRVRVSGAEQIPPGSGDRILCISNRSGVLPYDGLIISHAVERSVPDAPRPRFLVADWLVTLPFAQSTLARLGGVRACRENAERLLRSGRSVIAFPEGQKGALKPFADRYRLQRFGRGGFVSVALETRAVIVPVAVVGAEEAHPILFRSSLVERLLGVPVPFTPTFPHLGPLGAVPLPSQWRVRFGEPIRFDDVPAERSEDPLYINRTRERIRGAVQELLEDELHQRKSVFVG
jgi:1-acyl-sn-glycerol-3-phosphate acyltransferase